MIFFSHKNLLFLLVVLICAYSQAAWGMMYRSENGHRNYFDTEQAMLEYLKTLLDGSTLTHVDSDTCWSFSYTKVTENGKHGYRQRTLQPDEYDKPSKGTLYFFDNEPKNEEPKKVAPPQPPMPAPAPQVNTMEPQKPEPEPANHDKPKEPKGTRGALDNTKETEARVLLTQIKDEWQTIVDFAKESNRSMFADASVTTAENEARDSGVGIVACENKMANIDKKTELEVQQLIYDLQDSAGWHGEFTQENKEKIQKLLLLNKIEIGTAIARSILIASNQVAKNNFGNDNKKTLILSLLADVSRIANDIAMFYNEKYKTRGNLINWSSIACSVLVIISAVIKAKKMLKKENLKKKKFEKLKCEDFELDELKPVNFESENSDFEEPEAKRPAEQKQASNLITSLDKYGPYIEGLLAFARSGLKLNKFGNHTNIANACTVLIMLAEIAEFYTEIQK